MKTADATEEADAESATAIGGSSNMHSASSFDGSAQGGGQARAGSMRRRSGIRRRTSFLRQHYSRRNSNNSLRGEAVEDMLGDMAQAMADNEDLERQNSELSLNLSKMGIKLLILVCLLASMAIATGVTSYFAINKSRDSIQDSIVDSVITKVEVDESGTAHLTDKEGRDMSVRATGDLYSARIVKDTLYCLPIEDVASMANSVASGSGVNLALMDEFGLLEKEIIFLAGDFEDSGESLHFGSGKIHVHLDDDSCNDDDSTSAKGDLFKRGLDEITFTQLGDDSAHKQLDVLAWNREIYVRSRSVFNEGRRVLRGQGRSVPITREPERDVRKKELTEREISDFAQTLLEETQRSLLFISSDSDTPQNSDAKNSSEIIGRAMSLFEDAHGILDADSKHELMEILADDSINKFDESKVLMIEMQEGKSVCKSVPETGLCKGEDKSNIEQKIYNAILQRLQDYDNLDAEPDIVDILIGVEEEIGVDAEAIEWLINDSRDMAIDITNNVRKAREKYMVKTLIDRSTKLEQEIYAALDDGLDYDTAVTNSSLLDDEIEDAFRFFPQEKKDSMKARADMPMMKLKQRVNNAYQKLGFMENLNSGEWTWKGTSEDELFVMQGDGTLKFQDRNNGKSANETVEEAKQKVHYEHQGRRLQMKNHQKDMESLKSMLPSHIAVVQHRLLLELQDLAEDACPRIYLGCYLDSQTTPDLALNLGSGYSIAECLRDCHEKGYPYAGLKAASTCSCGDNTYGKHGSSDTSCTSICTNGPGTCGGPSANSIYEYFSMPNAECVSETFEDLATELGSVTSDVVSKVSGITEIMERMDWAAEKIQFASTLSVSIEVALQLGGAIPYVGPNIRVASKFIKPIIDSLQKANKRTKNFQNTVGEAWTNSFGKVQNLFESFETTFAKGIAGAAAGVSSIGSNQCVRSIFDGITGDILGSLDSALGSVLSYVQTLLTSLNSFLDVLSSSAWKTIEDGLSKILEGITPVLEYLNPLEPLAELLDKEITLPWFKLPYEEKFLGNAYCNYGYYKGNWPDKCWEKESSEWEEHWSLSPRQMKRKCSYAGYSAVSVTGSCWNDNYRSHRKGFSFTWWGKPYCSGNYGKYWFAPWECTKHCPSDRHMSGLGYCYKKSCKSGYSKCSWDNRQCNGHTRNQLSHTARCDSYSYKEGSRRYLYLGECWQGCNQKHTSVLGFCFPPASISLSINKVANAFNEIIEFIKDLPIVKQIQDAITSVINAVLKPVIDYINKLNPFSFPEFPSYDIDIPFNEIVSFDLPELPDLSQLSNIPEKVFSSLPGLPSPITDCGMDFNCIADATGMNEVINTIDTLQEVFDVLDIENLQRIFASVLSGATCSEWEDIVLPLNDLLSRVPALGYSGNSCDLTVPMCKQLDFIGSAAAAAMSELEDKLKSLSTQWGWANNMTSFLLKQIFTVTIDASILIQWGAPLSKLASFGGCSGRVGVLTKKKEKSDKIIPTWITTTVDSAYKMSPSIDFDNRQVSLTHSFGVDLTITWNEGVKSLLKGVLEKIEKNKPGKMAAELGVDTECKSSSEWKTQSTPLRERVCGMKIKAISQANQEWYVEYSSMPKWIKEHIKPTDLEDPTPKDCLESKLQQMVNSTNDFSSEKDFDEAYKCIKHWMALHDKVDKLREEIWPLDLKKWEEETKIGSMIMAMISKTSRLTTSGEKAYESFTGNKQPPPKPGFAFTIGLTKRHPAYKTKLGPTLKMGTDFKLVWIDLGAIEYRHLWSKKVFGNDSIFGKDSTVKPIEDWPSAINLGVSHTWFTDWQW